MLFIIENPEDKDAIKEAMKIRYNDLIGVIIIRIPIHKENFKLKDIKYWADLYDTDYFWRSFDGMTIEWPKIWRRYNSLQKRLAKLSEEGETGIKLGFWISDEIDYVALEKYQKMIGNLFPGCPKQ